jgi:anti-anti-sigma factor
VSTYADIAVDQQDTWIVARLVGEVDMTNADFVRDELTSAVPNDVDGLVLDLEGTQYLDSAAIELLFELSTRVGRRRQQLRLVLPPSSPLQRLIALTGVGAVAPLHASVADALTPR